MFKRYVIEFGTGADLHGMDVNKAAKKAVKDAISHGCLCGIEEILGVTDPNKSMKIDLLIAAPFPEKIDTDEIKKGVPFGEVNVKIVSGGLVVDGIEEASFGKGDKIVLVNAALTVFVDV